MKSRLVALALAAVMTLGSCMSASAKDVFTKGLIGGSVVKNGAYVESVDVIDVSIWDLATENSISADAQRVTSGANGATYTINGTTYTINNRYSVALNQLTTVQQEVLIRLIEAYGQDYVDNYMPYDTAVTAPYITGWSYDEWISRMQIAPYAERYIVAMNYKKLYTDLNTLAKRAVAQGQVTVSDAYSTGSDLATVKNALGVLDATWNTAAAAGDYTYSGCTLKVNGAVVTVDNGLVNIGGVNYNVLPTIAGTPTAAYVDATTAVAQPTFLTYLLVPQTGATTATVVYRSGARNEQAVRIPARTPIAVNGGVGSVTIGTGAAAQTISLLNIILSNMTYTSKSYQEEADNALAVAKELQASFAAAETYYKNEEAEGLVYLITKVRKDLDGKITKDNIDKKVALDVDPFDRLDWKLNEKKTIALTTPSLDDNKITETTSAIVLHFNTTACKWEAIDAKFVKYNGVLGVEGEFSSCSPVIIVSLKNFVDDGAAAAATATDAKKSPTTGEEF